MKVKAKWTKREGIGTWIMYIMWFILGYYVGVEERESIWIYILLLILMGIFIIIFGNKDKKRRRFK